MFALLVAAGHFLWALFAPRGQLAEVHFGNSMYVLAFVPGAILAWRTCRSLDGRARRTWQVFALMLSVWVAAQAASGWIEWTLQRNVSPTFSDAAFLFFLPFVCFGFARYRTHSRTTGSRLGFTLDTMMVTTAAATAYWHFFTAEALHDASRSWTALVAAIAFPAADLVTFALLFSTLLWYPRNIASREFVLVSAALAAYVAADVSYQYLLLTHGVTWSHPTNALWSLSGALFAFAAVAAQQRNRTQRGWHDIWQERAKDTLSILPHLGLLAVIAVLVSGPGDDGMLRRIGVTIGVILVALLALLRTTFAQMQERHLQRLLVQQARHDALTGALNRDALTQHARDAAIEARTRATPLALLAVNLDHFKLINHSLGQAAGDVALRETAKRLKGCVHSDDIVGRVAGDEFTVLLRGAGPDEARRVAATVVEALARPFELGGGAVVMSASVGIAMLDLRAADGAGMLFYQADLAMREVKQHGRNAWRAYEERLEAGAHRRLQLETHLAGALERGEFSVHYQPIVDLVSGRTRSLEALLRWSSPELGTVSPAEFVPVLEQRSLIVKVGAWVLREALRRVGEWHAAGHDVTVSVNVSSLQFQHGDFVELVRCALRDTGVSGSALVLELTESALIADADEGNATLCALRTLGARVSLDDFGTGYSSLSYLHRLSVDKLKIDKSFVQILPGDCAFMEVIMRLTSHLRLECVAEGVESEAQRETLLQLGCPFGQGFLFSRPLPADMILAFLDDIRIPPRGN
ncbi:putative bifunctional diguanylate cyclase/phosphodiesterase [Deinococcus peraridilitoris]|nr:bifunctional diguanylate cyclase/phosphodiesterase [Deinococcus peraridilitoris]